jgi:transcriptional regulator, XRE family
MAKYSTGRGGGGAAASACELCGADDVRVRAAEIAGAKLMVCASCAPHDDRATPSGGADGMGGEASRRKRIARQQAKMIDRSKADADRWVREGTNYEADALPYLVDGYAEVVQAARADAELSVVELAELAAVDASSLRSVEAGRAASDEVGGSVIRALEDALDVRLVDE